MAKFAGGLSASQVFWKEKIKGEKMESTSTRQSRERKFPGVESEEGIRTELAPFEAVFRGFQGRKELAQISGN